MKKIITVTLELNEENTAYFDNDAEIKNDIESELGCCWHGFEIKDINIKVEN